MIHPLKVKPYLLHKEGIVRVAAVRYFADSYIPEEDLLDIMPLIMESIETYPNQMEPNELALAYVEKWPLTSTSIKSILSHLQKSERYLEPFSQILSEADPRLLIPFLNELKEVLPEEFYGVIQYRVDFTEKETMTLWDELQAFAKEATGKGRHEFNFSYGEHLIVELASREDLSKETILENFEQSEKGSYLSIFLVSLLGRMKSKEITPILVKWLKHSTPLQREVAVEVMIQNGVGPSISQIKNQFSKTNNIEEQLILADVLRRIKTPESEQAILDLLEAEKDDLTIITSLANGLCEMVSEKGIPLVKKLIDEDYYDTGLLDLKESLYGACVMSDVNYEEFKEWKKDFTLTRKDTTTVPTFPDFDLTNEKIIPSSHLQTKQPKTSQPYVKEVTVGRNDPCPCGSGKKYKKCCGRN